MFDTVSAQLRLATSLALGVPFPARSLERVVAAMRDTIEEFGSLGADAETLLKGPPLDPAARRAIQARRFWDQARRAERDVPYYAGVLAEAGIDPRKATLDDVGRLPLTRKAALRRDPDAFVSRKSTPRTRATTTGSTGLPASVYFSDEELRLVVAFTASHVLLRRFVDPDDVVQVCLSSRATVALAGVMGSCALVGAPAYLLGLVDPALVLQMLTQRRDLPGKRPMASVMDIYPSHLGEVVEYGLTHGYKPSDFGIRRLIIGGEVVTDGLKERARELFGPVAFEENFAMTETVPMGGTQCSGMHLHYEVSAGLMEILTLDGRAPAEPGEVGTLVATPFPPYRETSVLLRYDTEDLAVPLAGLDCELSTFPASTRLLGKRGLSVESDAGWVFPRQVLEALEGLGVVPLPARFGIEAMPSGVALTVLARRDDARTRAQVGEALEAHGVPLRALTLVTDRGELRNAYPLRCDLREVAGFEHSYTRAASSSPPIPHPATVHTARS